MTRVWHHHGSDTQTSARAILHHTDPKGPNILKGSVQTTADLPTKQALGLLVIEPNVELGSKVGIQATSLKAEISCELILASSVIPPDLERGPTGSTLHKINSLQNACKKNLKTLDFNFHNFWKKLYKSQLF